MNVEEAINKYKKKFGGFSYFLSMGASEEAIIAVIEEALESGKEIEKNCWFAAKCRLLIT